MTGILRVPHFRRKGRSWLRMVPNHRSMCPFRSSFAPGRRSATSSDGRGLEPRPQFGQVVEMFRFAGPYRTRLIFGTLAVVVSSGLGLVFPRIMGDLVDTVVPSGAQHSPLRIA